MLLSYSSDLSGSGSMLKALMTAVGLTLGRAEWTPSVESTGFTFNIRLCWTA
jgi:hypothetical protein